MYEAIFENHQDLPHLRRSVDVSYEETMAIVIRQFDAGLLGFLA